MADSHFDLGVTPRRVGASGLVMSSLPQRPPNLGRHPGTVQPAVLHHETGMNYPPMMVSRPSYELYADGMHQSYEHEAVPPPPRPRKTTARHGQGTASTDHTPDRSGRKRQRAVQNDADSPSSSSRVKSESGGGVPAVLTREKKQKACANCRRAKLKCIVEDGEADCIRCKSRTEKCVFYPRSHDDDLQQTLTQDIYTAISHLADLSSAVHHILFHLTQSSLIPPFLAQDGRPLETYEAPERDLPAMQGWTAEQNQDLKPAVEKRKRRAHDEDEVKEEGIRHTSRRPSGPPQMVADGDLPDLHRTPSLEQYPEHFRQYALSTAYPPQVASGPIPGPMCSLPGLPINPILEARRPQPSITDPYLSALSQPRFNPTSNPSPPTLQDVTPNSIPQSSPLQSQSPIKEVAQHPPQLFTSADDPSKPSPAVVDDDVVLVPPDVAPGGDDMRTDVISEHKVSTLDAQSMINYSHCNLSPFLFGYHLGLGRFPYLPEGARTMTPLILGVLCMLASERLPHLFDLHPKIAQSVTVTLKTSPARSWQNLLPAVGALDSDELDPELGIGPEEIVATAMLSLWLPDSSEAPNYAAAAFKWARGWIKILTDEFPRVETIAELTCTVVGLRKATPSDMARVWLLCYIADGLVMLMSDTIPGVPHDPTTYCLDLIPGLFSTSPFDGVHANDIILTSHARLVAIFRDWQIKLQAYAVGQRNDNTLQRLAASIDYQIGCLRDSILGCVPAEWTSVKELELFALFFRTTMFSKLTGIAPGSSRQRATLVAQTVDVGLQGLELCSAWSGREELANLPQRYISMIYVIAHTVVEIVTVAANAPTPTGCSVTPPDVYPLLEQISQSLQRSGVPHQHKVKLCAARFVEMAEQLRNL